MPENAQRPEPDDPILSPADVGRRMKLLAALQAELTAAGVRCMLARKHRLVLRYNKAPLEPSGLTNPELHIFTPNGKDVATTDGLAYTLASGKEYPAHDLSAVVGEVVGDREALTPA